MVSMSGPERRQPDAAGHDDDVAPVHALDRPASPERSAEADLAADRQCRQGGCGRPSRPDGQLDGRVVDPGDGDRRGREAGQADHHELARERVWRVDPGHGQGHGVGGLAVAAEDAGRAEPGVVDRRGRRELQHGQRLPRRRRDDRQLLAHVDGHRAPRHAAAAADAAEGAELLDPGRELVGQPLAVAVLRAGAERAPGDSREAAREAGVPGPLRRRLDAIEVGDLLDAGAEAGRADERAVAAGQAALGDLRPARAVEGGLEADGQAGRRDTGVGTYGRACIGDATGGFVPLRVGRRSDGHGIEQRGAAGAADAHDEAVPRLGQHEVGAIADLGTGAHRRTEAGRGGRGALDGHDQRRLTTSRVVGIGDRPAKEDAVLDVEGSELAGANAEERDRAARRGPPP